MPFMSSVKATANEVGAVEHGFAHGEEVNPS
jgi:hypothetical protein